MMIVLFLLVVSLQNCCFGKYNDPIRLPIKKLLNFYPEFEDSVLKRSEMYTPPFSSPLAGSADVLIYSSSCTASNSTSSGFPCPSSKYNPSANSNAQTYSCSNIPGYSSACTGQQANTTVQFGGGNIYYNKIWTDLMMLASAPGFTRILVGETYQVSSPVPNVDGIMGLDFKRRSSTRTDSQIFTMIADENLYPAFRLQMNNSNPDFIIGQDDSLFPSMTFYDINYFPSSGSYDWSLNISSITVGGVAVLSTDTDFLIDSGASGFTFTSAIYTAMKAQFQANCGTNYLEYLCGTNNIFSPFGTRLYPTQSEIASYPVLTVFIHGDPYIITPELYLYFLGVDIDGDNYYSLLFSSSGSTNILGAAFLQGYISNYDIARSKIGFAPYSAIFAPTPAPTTPVPTTAPSMSPLFGPTVPTTAPTSSSSTNAFSMTLLISLLLLTLNYF